MKRLETSILAIMFLTVQVTCAKSPDRESPIVTFGLEWGYVATVYTASHFNYICSEGYRLDIVDRATCFTGNGDIMGFIGLNISDRIQFGVCSGLAGISRGSRVIPVEGRLTFYPKGYCHDGILWQAGGGPGINTNGRGITAMSGYAGGGYHVSLSRSIALNFMLDASICVDRPRIEDVDGGFVPERNIRRDRAIYHALSFSIALEF